MIGQRRAFIAIAAGVVLVGSLAAMRMRARPVPASRADVAPVETPPAAAPAWPTPVAGAAEPPAPPADGAGPGPLTPTGAVRALQTIAKNGETRTVFARLQPLGLSPEQTDRVVLILATTALRPAPRSPTLDALRADGHSRPLSVEEGKRVLAEQRRAADQTSRLLRASLASVLTPAQLAAVGLGDGLPSATPTTHAPVAAAATAP